jgi:hypothetical protein
VSGCVLGVMLRIVWGMGRVLGIFVVFEGFLSMNNINNNNIDSTIDYDQINGLVTKMSK